MDDETNADESKDSSHERMSSLSDLTQIKVGSESYSEKDNADGEF